MRGVAHAVLRRELSPPRLHRRRGHDSSGASVSEFATPVMGQQRHAYDGTI